MSNAIITIPTIDPIVELEFMRHVMRTFDRIPDYNDPIRKAIEQSFGINIGKSVKEFIFKRPDNHMMYVLLGDYEDIKKIYQTAHALTDRYWLYGSYPYDERTKCKVVGILSHDSLNSDLDYPCRMFTDIIGRTSPWDFYWSIARDLYIFKLDHASNNFAQYEQLMRVFGYQDQESMISNISIENTGNILYELLMKNNWAKAVNVVIQNYKYPFKKDEPTGIEYD